VFARKDPDMRYRPEHKLETRRQIIESARRLFNRKGFAEVSIDEVMENTGLTRGGFYRHFRDKEELYAEAVRHFLRKEVPERWQKGPAKRMPGKAFARFVVDAYLSRDHLEDIEGSCPLITLSSDAARSDGGVKAAYREVAQSMVEVFKANLPGTHSTRSGGGAGRTLRCAAK
jgi:TetR/AcrR family transcriptional repressor of nem operon